MRLLRLALAAAALVLAASWATRLAAPRPVAVLPSQPAQAPAPDVADAVRVFGLGGAAAEAAGIELTGIYAGGRRGGFATFRTPQGPASGVAGDPVRPGVVLQEVASDHVVLNVNGREQRLDLPARPAVSLDAATPNQP